MSSALSVVVPTRDRLTLLEGCLAALRADLRPGDEVLVVDSASVVAVPALPGARVLRAEAPGTSRARNLGWRASGHGLVAFVDDDVRVLPGWADALRAAFTDPAVAFVTGRIDLPPEQAGMERPVAVKTDLCSARLDAACTGTLGATANLGVLRAALLAVDGFDERLGPGARFHAAEDLDLFDRLFAAGLVGRYEPAAQAVHEQWRSRRELVALDWRYGVGMGGRLAKLARTDRRRCARLVREAVWTAGLRPVLGDVARGYEFGVLTGSTRVAGTLAGFVRGTRVL